MSGDTYGALSPADDLAIRALYARYNCAILRGDALAWAACFTADGKFSNRTTGVSGHEDLVVYAERWIGAGNARYWIDNLILTATENGASGTCYLTIFRAGAGDGAASLELTGIYTDELTFDGEWLFSSRHIARDE